MPCNLYVNFYPRILCTLNRFELSIGGFVYALLLPALRSMKVTPDNATFLNLSCWDMCFLTPLGYAAGGFRRFFQVHG